jgi:Mycobacterium 19 kDa lipoprotein antigen
MPILAFSRAENSIIAAGPRSFVIEDRGGLVPNRLIAAAVAAIAVAGVGACTARPQTQLSSTAQVTINGTETGSHVAKCSQQGWYRTIAIGGDFAHATVAVDGHAEKLTVTSVRIQNLGGFTGTFVKNGDDDATSSFSGDKFTITGTANGFNVDKPNEAASATFKIVATC